ncbi:cytochrome P450 81Q32-like [Impatiens glandulifera]|uniref:cytochrome P450 81Q32-like n=1 Tax=Impatiens glandulifera TaxID=253017 RepID=UPI001FB0FF5F|nr:cytochrome P450 81Q32-like [Impatiens glandulifera]
MKQIEIYLISLIITTILFIFLLKLIFKRKLNQNLPPSPPSLPILGHLHLLKKPLHRTLHHLSQTYGPVYLLRFGSRLALVVSSPSLAEECFTNNDVVFANRPRLMSGKHLNYNYNTIGASSYGHLWRNLRRVATVELLSATKLNMFLDIRQDEVKSMVKNLFMESKSKSKQGFTRVEMQSRCSELSFNIIMKMVAGNRYFGNKGNIVEDAKRFRKIISEIFQMVGASPGDFIPLLKWIDYKNREKRMLAVRDKMDVFMQRLIEEHRLLRGGGDENRSKTMVDAMLSLQDSDPQYNSDEIIKGMIMTMLSAGTDTSSVTIEWAMSLMLNNPDILKKASLEINDCIGQDRLVDETDLSKLPYIQSIANETLRLFPAAPLLVPHENSEACTIGGYDVPRGTILFVNAWAIHRDSSIWEEPTKFKPERFSHGGEECEGFKWIPFGMGRRRCPGGGLANKVVCLALAALVQCFEWERVSVELVDMLEGSGLTMPKAVPLEAMCKAREEMVHVLSHL